MVHFFIGASCLTSDKQGSRMPRIRARLNTPRNVCLHSITGGPPALTKHHQSLPESFSTCQVRSGFPGSALASPHLAPLLSRTRRDATRVDPGQRGFPLMRFTVASGRGSNGGKRALQSEALQVCTPEVRQRDACALWNLSNRP